jgi:hypothetical protein
MGKGRWYALSVTSRDYPLILSSLTNVAADKHFVARFAHIVRCACS